MELNNTTVTETSEFQAGSKGHIVAYDRVGSGYLDLQLKTENGYKSVVSPINDAMLNAEGAEGGSIPMDAIPGQWYKIVNHGFSKIYVEIHIQTT